MTAHATELARVRRALHALLLLGFVGTGAELLLAEHTEDAWQLVPLGLLGAGTALLLIPGLARRRAGMLAFQGLMALFIAAGAAGAYLHYSAKAEFALERAPDLRGPALLREAMKGSSPPLLAPGAMAALGLLGLIWCPRRAAATTPTSPDPSGA